MIKNILKNQKTFSSNVQPWMINKVREEIDTKAKISFIANDDENLIISVKLIIDREYTISDLKLRISIKTLRNSLKQQ